MTNGNDTIGGMDTLGGWHEGEAAPERRRDADTLSGGETLGADGRIVLAGRYAVVKRLGEGGMGSVWLAEDRKLDGRKVAIKMLPAILAGKKAAYKQVKAEALMAMKLAHPNIATVRSFEEDEGGNPFLVMDCIEGQGLDDLLADKGTLSEEETVKLLAPVAAALDYAHAQGVVHRDVKPGNVMVDRNGTPFVLDFGIAREVQETMTRVTGKLSSGTLLYMSPEQLKGRAPKAAQDVYSFAVMAYECLTGAPPFSRGQIEWQIVNEQPEPLPDGVGEALRNGVMAGLAKDPNDRPASCTGVLGGRVVGGASRLGEPDGLDSGLPTASQRLGGDASPHPLGKSEDSGNLASARQGRLAPPAPRPTGHPLEKMTGEDVFLRKVQLGKELEAVGEAPDLTPEEKAALTPIREMFAAGEEALRAGDKGAAGGLFAQAQSALEAWRGALTARREGERRAEEERKRAEEELKRAEQERREEELRNRKPGMTRTLVLPGGAKMEMVWCPPGTFLMGSPEDEENPEGGETQHEVTLSRGFWMAKTPVTQRQWRSVMGANPSSHKGDDLPVECVNWNDAQAFCEKCREAGILLRLPTEAQWEYACRAGSTGAYAGTGRVDDMAWYDANSDDGKFFHFRKTHPVGMKAANAWGLHDMHGNVWEWCADWYDEEYYAKSPGTDPTGPASGGFRVLRGGSWASYARSCRSASRLWNPAGCRSSYVGFRPVCSAGPVQ